VGGFVSGLLVAWCPGLDSVDGQQLPTGGKFLASSTTSTTDLSMAAYFDAILALCITMLLYTISERIDQCKRCDTGYSNALLRHVLGCGGDIVLLKRERLRLGVRITREP